MTCDPIALAETATIEEAALAMREADVGAVLVMRRDTLRGILTDRDVLPVVDTTGRPVGIVSLGDLACSRDPASLHGGISAARANT